MPLTRVRIIRTAAERYANRSAEGILNTDAIDLAAEIKYADGQEPRVAIGLRNGDSCTIAGTLEDLLAAAHKPRRKRLTLPEGGKQARAESFKDYGPDKPSAKDPADAAPK